MSVPCRDGTVELPRQLNALLIDFFSRLRCGDLTRDQKVVSVSADSDVTTICKTLMEHNISSAPVYDALSQSYLGLIDYRDLVDYILIVWQNIRSSAADPTQAIEIESIMKKVFKGEPVKARLTTDLSRHNPFYSVMPESSLLVAIDVMKSGIHRVCVLDEESHVVGVLSQTDVIKQIYKHGDIMATLDQLSVKDLNICHSPAIFAYGEEKVSVALNRMHEHGLSSLAVIDHHGNLIGNFSVKDVKCIFSENKMSILWSSCAHFVSKCLSDDGLERGRDRYPFFDVCTSASVGYVIRKLLATKTHRIWVVDAKETLIGVISITDVLRALWPNMSES